MHDANDRNQHATNNCIDGTCRKLCWRHNPNRLQDQQRIALPAVSHNQQQLCHKACTLLHGQAEPLQHSLPEPAACWHLGSKAKVTDHADSSWRAKNNSLSKLLPAATLGSTWQGNVSWQHRQCAAAGAIHVAEVAATINQHKTQSSTPEHTTPLAQHKPPSSNPSTQKVHDSLAHCVPHNAQECTPTHTHTQTHRHKDTETHIARIKL